MLWERPVHPDVRTLLMSNQPFQYAHLIKFERPSRPEAGTGVISTSAYKYAYLTDASRDVSFDDLSKDLQGVANGTQRYIANKLLDVTGLQESVEAQPSNFSLTLDANGLGATVTAAVTISAVAGGIYWDVDFPEDIDVIACGFREGDKVTFTGLSPGDYNIDSFRTGNVVRIKKLETTPTTGSGTVTMTLSSEEIKALLMDKKAPGYASFINREVFVYRAYFQEGEMIGATPVAGVTGPILIFKGIIANVNFEETEEGIKVQWGLTSHWGDFAQVKGRITSDDFHRGLDSNGVPQETSAIKPAYAYDKGFLHAETSINLLAQYTVSVEKTSVKSKSGFLGLGIGSKVKVKKYYVDEKRHSPLDFQLTAKSIPLIYGVRNTGGIPIFADTLLTDPSVVYVAYALCEGQAGGIYDIYINGKSLICGNESDFDVRSQQNEENTIDVVCSGRADRGDVLLGTTSVGAVSGTSFYEPNVVQEDYALHAVGDDFYNSPTSQPVSINFHQYLPANGGVASSELSGGVTHGKSVTVLTPQEIYFDFFSGTEGQVAAPQLVNIAYNNGFKIQNDYWTGSGGGVEYWGPNHRLLDTAYVVARYKIKEGETTIPDIEFITRGKVIDCYNYDGSFAHDEKVTQNPDNFKLGQTVTLLVVGTNQNLGTFQIIDKWKMIRPDGVVDTRFRFSGFIDLDYDEQGVPAITHFRMTDGTNNWHMVTFNYAINSGTITTELTATVTDISPDPGGGVIITVPPGTGVDTGGTPGQGGPVLAVDGTGAVPASSTTTTTISTGVGVNLV